jgi:hypothetical protein
LKSAVDRKNGLIAVQTLQDLQHNYGRKLSEEHDSCAAQRFAKV